MAKEKQIEVIIPEIKKGLFHFHVVGTMPLIYNRMSEKAKRQLLLPPPKGRAARAGTLKHDPLNEYRDSVYRTKVVEKTLLVLPTTTFKAAAMTASLDVPGSNKTQMGRLIWVIGDTVPIYGIPQLHMCITKNSGINKTPDVRTRAIVPRWATRFSVEFVTPMINGQSVANILAAAGMTCGVGDFRQERGKGNYGTFRICNPDDKEYMEILAMSTADAQEEALQNPTCYDQESEDLLRWFYDEVATRGVAATKQEGTGKKRQTKKNGGTELRVD